MEEQYIDNLLLLILTHIGYILSIYIFTTSLNHALFYVICLQEISGDITFTLKNMILLNGGVVNNSLRMNCRPGWGIPIDDCYIYKGEGGCIYAGWYTTVYLNNVDFIECKSIGIPQNISNSPLDTRYRGGAIYSGGSTQIHAINCTFCSKLSLLYPKLSFFLVVLVVLVVIYKLICTIYSYATEEGGAFYAGWSSAQVTITCINSKFYNNSCDDPGRYYHIIHQFYINMKFLFVHRIWRRWSIVCLWHSSNYR